MNHVLLFCGSTKFKEKKRQSYELVLIVVILKFFRKNFFQRIYNDSCIIKYFKIECRTTASTIVILSLVNKNISK